MTDLNRDTEMFLFYFSNCAVDKQLPFHPEKETMANFRVHKDKLKDACWCKAQVQIQAKIFPDCVVFKKRLEICDLRIKELSEHLKKLNQLLPKVRRTQLWLEINNEKNS